MLAVTQNTTFGPQASTWQSLLMGIILGMDAVGHCLALATICFSGALAQGLGLATALFLLGSVATTLVLNKFGGFRLSLAISQDTTISILAPAVIVAATSAAGPVEAKIATALAVIGVSAITTGLAFWSIGRLGIGRIVRMFPYPVAAGFLASSGYLLVYSAIVILTEQTSFSAMFEAAKDPWVQLRLIPAVLMALSIVIAIRVWSGTTAVPLIIFVFMAGFYVSINVMGLDLSAAVKLGLLPRVGPTTDGHLSFAMIGMVDWWALLGAVPVILAVVMLNLIGMLLNTSGVELATRADVDENRELMLTGKTNLVVGAFGGLSCYLQSGATIMAAKLGLDRRAMIIGHNGTLLLACAVAPIMVAVIPSFVPAALLIFIGLSMLEDWLANTWRRLKLLDWLIVLGIVLATAVFGVLPAICIGIAMAILGFAFALIRLPIIRQSSNITKRRSIRDRNTLQVETLQREGSRVHIIQLHGPLFFGSVEQITANLREVTKSIPDMQAMIIDFAEVYSFDSSACAALEKLAHIMESKGISMHLTGLSPSLLGVFNKWGLGLFQNDEKNSVPAMRVWSNFEDALEHCETALLSQQDQVHLGEEIVKTLSELGRKHKRSADLLAKMERRKLSPGEVLIKANEKSADIYILVSGHLAVHLPSTKGKSLRVRSMGHGAIVGEIAYLTGQPRNADVISEDATEVLCLREKVIRQIEKNDPELAALIMSILCRSLAAKLSQSNLQLANSRSASIPG